MVEVMSGEDNCSTLVNFFKDCIQDDFSRSDVKPIDWFIKEDSFGFLY